MTTHRVRPIQVSFHKQPRTGGTVLGAGKYKVNPGYWTGWSRGQGSPKEAVVELVMEGKGLQRNICSVVLDANIYPQLATIPFLLR